MNLVLASSMFIMNYGHNFGIGIIGKGWPPDGWADFFSDIFQEKYGAKYAGAFTIFG